MTIKKKAATAFFSFIGGAGMIVAAIMVNWLFDSPPSRAEFDTFKVKTIEKQLYLEKELKSLHDGQQKIYQYLINKEK